MPPDSEDTAYKKSFHHACINDDLAKIQEALASGQLSTKTLDKGLCYATEKAHPDMVAALLDAGVCIKPDTVDSLWAVDGRHDPRIIRLFFDHGLTPRKCTLSHGEPLLRYLPAACTRELLERGVDPNRCGPKKIAPLASALADVAEDGGALFDLLVEYGATMESSLFFSAIAWSRSNTVPKVKFLLSKGLDPNATCAVWGTPLHCAIRFAMHDIIRILLDAGADPTARVMCKMFDEQSPKELAERGIRLNDSIRSMQNSFRKILKLVTDAQVDHTTSTSTLSKKPTGKGQLEQPNMDAKYEHASNSVHADTEKPSTQNATQRTAKTRKASKQHTDTRKREISKDSISSRTRSRTEVVS